MSTTAGNPWWLQHGRPVGFGLIAVGAVMAVAAFAGVRQADFLLNELSYIASGGVGGVFCVGVGTTVLIATDLAVTRRRLELQAEETDLAALGEQASLAGLVDVASAEQAGNRAPDHQPLESRATVGVSATTARQTAHR